MSAPISIPVVISTDEGVEALLKLAGGFDTAGASAGTFGDKLGAVQPIAQSFRGEIDLGTKALRALAGAANSAAKNVSGLSDVLNTSLSADQRKISSLGDMTIAYRAAAVEQKVFLDQTRALAGVSTASAVGGGASVAQRDAQMLRLGSTSVGPASFGGSALGIPVPAIAAVIAGYLGLKAVETSNAYNQSITDIVSQSTQNAASIPGLQQGVLNLAGGLNRNTPQQLAQGLYPIASSPIFANQADQINALRIVSQQSQGSGPDSIKPLASADVGAVSAFGFSPSQLQMVADTIAKGVNIGLAESADFAKGVGSFSAAALAADPNKIRSFQQSIGAFAQQTNLSPRFRFDAQGENAFLQQINTPLKGHAAQEADALGITDLFGPGAEGKAGGLAAWLQQFQSATQGSNQQSYLQNLGFRQNSLQFVRGFTGSNFLSGQASINATSDAAGTVLRGANIADSGPQAQWDQIQSTFNKDVIQVGDTISKTLNPALTNLAGNTAKVAAVMGDTLGILGTSIGKYVNFIDGLKLPGGGSLIPGGFGTDFFATAAGPLGLTLAATYGLISHAGQIKDALDPTNSSGGGATSLSPAQALANAQYKPGHFLSYFQQSGGAAATSSIAPDGTYDYSPGRHLLAHQVGQQQTETAYNRAINQARANALNGLPQAFMDSASSELGPRGEAHGNPTNAAAIQRLVDAAQKQFDAATTFQTSVQLHQGTLAQSDAAAEKVYQASMNLISVQLANKQITPADAAGLRAGIANTRNQTLLSDLQGPMAEAQAGFQLAQLTGKGLSGARATEADLLRRQAAIPGGLGPNQLALDLYQLGQQGQTSKVATPGETLIRSQESGLGDSLLGAGSGAGTIARLSQSGGQDPLAKTVQRLEQIIRNDDKIIAELQRGNDINAETRDELKAAPLPPRGSAPGSSSARRQFGF